VLTDVQVVWMTNNYMNLKRSSADRGTLMKLYQLGQDWSWVSGRFFQCEEQIFQYMCQS